MKTKAKYFSENSLYKSPLMLNLKKVGLSLIFRLEGTVKTFVFELLHNRGWRISAKVHD